MDIDDTSITFIIRKRGTLQAVIITSLVTFVLGFTDLVVGSEISFSIFYLIPITLAVFLSGKRLAFIFSSICSIIWILADIASGLSYSSLFIPIWNMLVRFGYFIFHSMLLAYLVEAIAKVKETSFRDPLTKAANWRYFEEYSNTLIKSAVRDKTGITVAYLDVDDFKKINDTFGHAIGDEVLIVLTRLIQKEIRPQDLLARLGGDEFAIILNNTEIGSAKEILVRINTSVLDEMRSRKWEISLSIGAVVFSVLPSSIGPMLKKVDDLMYEVKRNGKNGIKVEEQLS